MPSILIVDDDIQIRELLKDYLTQFGMSVYTAAEGQEMKNVLGQYDINLIILDLMLPGEDGISLCRNLRSTSQIPILMLTSRGESMDRVVGLEVGADDYMVKPFEPRELVARINTILRRSGFSKEQTGINTNSVSFSGWRLNNTMRQLVSPEQVVVPLSNAEFRLLRVFIDHPNRVLSRDFLLDQARGRNMELFDRSIDLLVSRLRQKVRDDPRTPSLIKTVRGEGYIFDAKVA